MTNKDVKAMFKIYGIQTTKDSIDQVQRELKGVVRRMALRCKEGNVKRLTTDLVFIAMGKLND